MRDFEGLLAGFCAILEGAFEGSGGGFCGLAQECGG